MMAEKVIKMLTQLTMVVLLTRYLLPTEFGDLMYCYAIVSTLGFLNTLGMESLLVKRFVDEKLERFSYLKNALIVRAVSSLACVLLANLVGLFLVEEESRVLLFTISLYHLAMPVSIFTWFFQSEGRGDRAAIGLVAGALIAFIYRLVCLIISDSLVMLGVAYLIELIVVGMVYMATFVRFEGVSALQSPKFSLERSSLLIKDCLPLIFSGALVLLYMKIDQVMLGSMIGKEEVGVYVAATRLSEAWYFIGLTLISVYFPKILNIRYSIGHKRYYAEIIKSGKLIVWAAIILASLTSIIATPLISFLYGDMYLKSAEVLIVSIWAVPFVYLGAIASKMYIVESKQGSLFWRSFWGLLVNVFLNYALIPDFGATGAAASSLISQVVTGVVFNFFNSCPGVLRVQLKIMTLR